MGSFARTLFTTLKESCKSCLHMIIKTRMQKHSKKLSLMLFFLLMHTSSLPLPDVCLNIYRIIQLNASDAEKNKSIAKHWNVNINKHYIQKWLFAHKDFHLRTKDFETKKIGFSLALNIFLLLDLALSFCALVSLSSLFLFLLFLSKICIYNLFVLLFFGRIMFNAK